MIRAYSISDLDRIKEITSICFDGASVDRNIETFFGIIGGHDWQWRKLRHIDSDVEGDHARGVFVWDEGEYIVGYVTTRLDFESKIGRIPNIAVDPNSQNQGIGRKLLDYALDFMRKSGMECAKIETLEQNMVGQHLYPEVGFHEVAKQIHYIKTL